MNHCITSIDHCRYTLLNHGPAIAGQGGDLHTFSAACLGGDFGIPERLFWPLLLEWNRTCKPPWSEHELRNKLRSAEKNRKYPKGWRCVQRSYSRTTNVNLEGLYFKKLVQYPSQVQVSRLWNQSTSVLCPSAELTACYLTSRGLPPSIIASMDIARSLHSSEPPRWAWGPSGPWTCTSYSLLCPLYDLYGSLKSFRARWIHVDAAPPNGIKSLAPARFATQGLIFANIRALELFKEGRWPLNIPTADWELWIAEGEIDFLALAITLHDRAVIGVDAGSWTTALASRIPTETKIVIATDHDSVGNRYARQILDSLRTRCLVYRHLGKEIS